jgi:hypothetical protein
VHRVPKKKKKSTSNTGARIHGHDSKMETYRKIFRQKKKKWNLINSPNLMVDANENLP